MRPATVNMDTKQRIQEKANDLFRRYGIKSITMDEIATQLGVSKKTLYQYFSDKDELVEAIVKNTIKGAQDTCDKYEVIKNNLRRGIREDLYRSNINIEVIARFRLEGMMLAFNQDIFPSSKFNLGELHKALIEHFLFGVASSKGYKLIVKYQQERIKINQ